MVKNKNLKEKRILIITKQIGFPFIESIRSYFKGTRFSIVCSILQSIL